MLSVMTTVLDKERERFGLPKDYGQDLLAALQERQRVSDGSLEKRRTNSFFERRAGDEI